MATIETIMAGAKATRRKLSDLEMDLTQEIEEIAHNAFMQRRKMTEEERLIRNERRAQRSEARDASEILAIMTLHKLNQSDEVKLLTLKMKKINNDLSDDLESLKKIERYAATAAQISGGLARVAKRVAAIVV